MVHCCTKLSGQLERVKIGKHLRIKLNLKIRLSQATPIQHSISDAGSQDSLITLFKLVDIRYFNGILFDCTENILLIHIPICIRFFPGDLRNDLMEVISGYLIHRLQLLLNRTVMSLFHFPRMRHFCITSSSCVSNIKNISQFEITAIIHQQCDTVRASLDISVHRPIPDIVLSTGCCIGPLCINQDLILMGVFVKPG